jgi:hypothetical protein
MDFQALATFRFRDVVQLGDSRVQTRSLAHEELEPLRAEARPSARPLDSRDIPSVSWFGRRRFSTLSPETKQVRPSLSEVGPERCST